jgi:hypothetical protein
MMAQMRKAQREVALAEAVTALGLDPIAQALHGAGYRLLPVRLPAKPVAGRTRLRLVWQARDGQGVLTVRYTRTVPVA